MVWSWLVSDEVVEQDGLNCYKVLVYWYLYTGTCCAAQEFANKSVLLFPDFPVRQPGRVYVVKYSIDQRTGVCACHQLYRMRNCCMLYLHSTTCNIFHTQYYCLISTELRCQRKSVCDQDHDRQKKMIMWSSVLAGQRSNCSRADPLIGSKKGFNPSHKRFYTGRISDYPLFDCLKYFVSKTGRWWWPGKEALHVSSLKKHANNMKQVTRSLQIVMAQGKSSATLLNCWLNVINTFASYNFWRIGATGNYNLLYECQPKTAGQFICFVLGIAHLCYIQGGVHLTAPWPTVLHHWCTPDTVASTINSLVPRSWGG